MVSLISCSSLFLWWKSVSKTPYSKTYTPISSRRLSATSHCFQVIRKFQIAFRSSAISDRFQTVCNLRLFSDCKIWLNTERTSSSSTEPEAFTTNICLVVLQHSAFIQILGLYNVFLSAIQHKSFQTWTIIFHGFSNVERFSDVCNIMIRICSMSTEVLCIVNRKKPKKKKKKKKKNWKQISTMGFQSV
jgi:hypothetical protein